MRSTLVCAFTLCSAAPLAHAGQVWIVDDDGGAGVDFTSIQAAIEAAADGDTVLVKEGDYAGFHVFAKALAIVGEKDASIAVGGGSSVRGLAASQHVVLRGLGALHGSSADAQAATLATEALVIKNCAGSVWVEGATIEGGYATVGTYAFPSGAAGALALEIENAASVVLAALVVRGSSGSDLDDEFVTPNPGWGASAVRATNSQIAVHGCDLRGGHGGSNTDTDSSPGGAGAHGLHMIGGSAHIAGSKLAGGYGGFGGDGGFFGSCGSGGSGGDGLRVEGATASAETLDCTLVAGNAGPGGWDSSGPCSPGAPGLAVRVLGGAQYAALAGRAVGLALPSPLRELESAHAGVSGAPGSIAWLAYAGAPAQLELAGLVGVLALAPPVVLLPLGALPASGAIAVPFTPLDLGAGVEAALVRAQAVALDPVTLTATLGAPASVVLLDASF
ncbi:MAG: hypothetical protein EPO68_07855 [Planctomycetota bacterium]|nr:MAG: hypothetical protein EPO68_07855 [Planctomycetota bacterium]